MKLPNLSEVEKRFSPVYWGYTSSIPEKAYKAVCPTVSELDELYGSGSSSYWINVQITALFGSSSNRDVELICGIKLFSDSFASQVGIYKLSELMLFFSRYKAGTYDNSYSTFDTRRIGGAFFKEFLPQRLSELTRIQREDYNRDIQEKKEQWKKTSVTYEEYLKIKKNESTLLDTPEH